MKRRAAIWLALATVVLAPCLFAGKPPPDPATADPVLSQMFRAVCLKNHTNNLTPIAVQQTPGKVISVNAVVRAVTLTFECPKCPTKKRKFTQEADVMAWSVVRPKAVLLAPVNLPTVPTPLPPLPPAAAIQRNPSRKVSATPRRVSPPPLPPDSAPVLWIGTVTETNLVVSPLGEASAPILVDLRSNTIAIPAEGATANLSVVCPDGPVLTVEIQAAAGTTNEIQSRKTLDDPWTNSNVRWIGGPDVVRYYITSPVSSMFYRVIQRS